MQTLNLVKKKKEEINKILKDIETTNDKEKQLKLFKDALKIDNTNRQIVNQYLLLVKQIRDITDKKENPVIEIMTYIHHFPPEQFNKDFFGFAEKKISSMGKILLILNKILSEEWNEAKYEKKKEAASFLLNAIIEDKFEIRITSPITWENDELYIFNLYLRLLEQIKRKIEYYKSSNDINDNKINCDNIAKCHKCI